MNFPTSIPDQLNLFNISINTFGIFLLFGFLLLAFIVWQEGRQDGFDEERLFDIFLVSSVSSVLFSRAFYAVSHSVTATALINQMVKIWTPGFDPLGALLGFIMPVFLFSRLWKWSFYHLVDVFSVGASLGLAVIGLGYVGIQGRFEFLFSFGVWVIMFAILTKLRNIKLKSGYGFSIFLLINALMWYVFFGIGNNLIFFVVLVTLSLVVILFRWKISNDKTFARIFRKTKK